MAITKQKKEELIKKLTDIGAKSNSIAFINFTNISANDINQIRTNLIEKGVNYLVTKKTLIKKVLQKSAKGEMPELDGEVALVYGEDSYAPAQSIYKEMKKHKNSFNILGGVFEKQFITKQEMENIASIPPKDVLYGQFVGVLQYPIRRMAVVLSQIQK